MTARDQLCGQVAAQLRTMSNPGGPLHTDSDRSTNRLYATSPTRSEFQLDAVDWYLSLVEEAPSQGGRSVLLTSGPPGAGKSTLLDGDQLSDYRRLDADVLKDYLIEQAMAEGIYDDLLATQLSDGANIAPRELASLVHNESTMLLADITNICIQRHENVIVEATLRWQDHGPELIARFGRASYSVMRVLSLDVPQALAEKQAVSRWWAGRTDWIGGKNSLGGRFMPPTAIADCFDGNGSSRCVRHALRLPALAKPYDLEVKLELYERNSEEGTVHRVIGPPNA